MEVLTNETFRDKVFDYQKEKEWVFSGGRPAIVDFYADWCAPCRALSPVLEALAKDYAGQIDIYKVNTEETPELSAAFGIRGIPALLFIPKEGKPSMATGFLPRESLEAAIGELFQLERK